MQLTVPGVLYTVLGLLDCSCQSVIAVTVKGPRTRCLPPNDLVPSARAARLASREIDEKCVEIQAPAKAV